MGFIDDASDCATTAIPGAGTPDAQTRALDIMPMPELCGLWCSLQYVGLREQTEELWGAILYFDRMPHEQPERALELVLAVLRSEAHKSVKMELNTKFFVALIRTHGNELADKIEEAARQDAQMRWLLGGAYWWATDSTLKARLADVADPDGWRADADTRDAPAARVDYAALTLPELARAWVEQTSKPRKDQDDNWNDLMRFEAALQENDPDRVIDLILEILTIEHNASLLSYLAAGPLEDVVSIRTIDRIEREATRNPAFRVLLGGVWYPDEADELKTRLDAILGRTATH
jgi:hypothetical protein